MTDNKSDSKLRSMILKGKNYREDYELEYFGETTDIELRPLKDTEFVEIVERIDDVVDEEEFEDNMEDIDDLDEEEMPDEADFDKDFVEVMRDAAKLGIDNESAGLTQEELDELVDELIGGVSIDIGAEVLDITSNLQDADRFRKRR